MGEPKAARLKVIATSRVTEPFMCVSLTHAANISPGMEHDAVVRSAFFNGHHPIWIVPIPDAMAEDGAAQNLPEAEPG